jgi:two-component system, chemotaxis family, response regulator PixG
MTRAVAELYTNLVARDRSHPFKPPDPQTSIATVSRLSLLLVSYSQKQFTGSIEIDSVSGRKWSIHYRLGRIIWTSGGCHPLRRWRRSLQQSGVAIDFQQIDWSHRTCPHTPWGYHLLAITIEQKYITREQAKSVIIQTVRDTIFDLLQEEAKHPLKYRLQSEETLGNLSIVLKSESVLWQVIRDWQAWCQSNLKNYSPNDAPRLLKPDRFARTLNPASYRQIENLTSGRYSLRDLAIRLDRNLITFTQSLMPYVRQEAIELIEIPDEPMEWIESPH